MVMIFNNQANLLLGSKKAFYTIQRSEKLHGPPGAMHTMTHLHVDMDLHDGSGSRDAT